MITRWLCLRCGLIHKPDIRKCKCGNVQDNHSLVSPLKFDSEEHLERWVTMMRLYAGAKIRIARNE